MFCCIGQRHFIPELTTVKAEEKTRKVRAKSIHVFIVRLLMWTQELVAVIGEEGTLIQDEVILAPVGVEVEKGVKQFRK